MNRYERMTDDDLCRALDGPFTPLDAPALMQAACARIRALGVIEQIGRQSSPELASLAGEVLSVTAPSAKMNTDRIIDAARRLAGSVLSQA